MSLNSEIEVKVRELAEKVQSISEALHVTNKIDTESLDNVDVSKSELENNSKSYRTYVLNAANLLEKGVMKIALGIQSVKEGEEVTSLCNALLKPYEQFATFAFILMNDKTLCNDLREQWTTATRNICETLKLFLESTLQGNQKGVLQHTGVISSLKESLTEIPTTNRSAIKRKCLKIVPLVQDTKVEFQVMIETALSTGLSQAGVSEASSSQVPVEEDASDDGWDDFDDFGEEEMSVEEVPTVQLALECLELAKSVVVKSGKAIGGIPEESTGSEFTSWLNEFDGKLSQMRLSVTNLGSELYPSLDYEELGVQGNQFKNRVLALSESVSARLESCTGEALVVEQCDKMKKELDSTTAEFQTKINAFVSKCESS